MKFFNIDAHISVIADIKNIFENLGHTVDKISISGHNWVLGLPQQSVPELNNWHYLNENTCNIFYKKYKNTLEKYDAFICAYPPAFSLLYEKFNKPIIVIAATRYEFPFTFDENRWKNLNKYLSNNKNVITIANNKFDKYYCEMFTEKKWYHIPSLCEYTKTSYKPTKKESVYFSKLKQLNGFINKNSLGSYSWEHLYSHNSIIHIPYNYSTMSIFEQYTANIPLLFPTKEYIIKLFLENTAMTEISFRQVFNCSPDSLFDLGCDPNNYANLDLFVNNLQYADFYDEEWMPHINYFNSEEDLNKMHADLNFEYISDKMKEKNIERKQSIFNLWNNILGDL